MRRFAPTVAWCEAANALLALLLAGLPGTYAQFPGASDEAALLRDVTGKVIAVFRSALSDLSAVFPPSLAGETALAAVLQTFSDILLLDSRCPLVEVLVFVQFFFMFFFFIYWLNPNHVEKQSCGFKVGHTPAERVCGCTCCHGHYFACIA